MKELFVWVKSLQTKLILIAGLVLGLYAAHMFVVHKEVARAKAEVVLSYEKEKFLAIERALETRQAIEDQLYKEMEEKNEKIASLASRYIALNTELRSRPSRQERDSGASENRKTCTGAELFREDAEFLTREAQRADELIIERDFYFNSYERVREEIEKLKNGN